MRLAEDRFYNQYPCIIITAKGQPDVATRLFLRSLKQELKIPVLALVVRSRFLAHLARWRTHHTRACDMRGASPPYP